MADTKISALAAATGAVTNELPVNEGGTSKKLTVSQILALAYPVGSIYISTAATNPNTLFGFGTWAAFGAGRVLVGLDAGDIDFDTAEKTGGAKTHTLVTAEMPAHTHVQTQPSVQTGNFACGTRDTSSGGTGASPTTVADALSTASTGGGGAHNNLQPYIVVYLWKRTA